ncbi:MAG: RluA family pseudouridine synthase [Lachnospiraceae bacterium]|nr:RluA family pseudouridine synthase [Lachnospiraceae bacterium]
MEQLEFMISPEESNTRIDKYLSEQLEGTSRSYIQKLIENGQVSVNGKAVKSNYKLRADDVLSVEIPEPEELKVEAEEIPLSVLYEDEQLLVVDKPKGMVVHPAAGHYNGTLVNALLYHCKDQLSGINGVMRPGIVHRIDRNTTGALVVCKTDLAHQSLAEQLKVHSITRKYRGIVHGNIKEDEGTIHSIIGRDPKDRKKMASGVKNGKDAVTHYRVLERFGNYTYAEFVLETGRTHQIRVHMRSIGHPLLGDDLYGPAKCPFNLEGQTLHAMVLGFIHPVSGSYMEFTAPLPEYFEKLLGKLRV